MAIRSLRELWRIAADGGSMGITAEEELRYGLLAPPRWCRRGREWYSEEYRKRFPDDATADSLRKENDLVEWED